jgi:CDP-diacylglycerol--serine O-phosphatidyltransferase
LAVVSLGVVLNAGAEAMSLSVRGEALLAVAAIISWLLISPVRMFSLKFKSLGWRGNELRYIFLASSAVLIVIFEIGGVSASVGLYVLLSTMRHVANMLRVPQK